MIHPSIRDLFLGLARHPAFQDTLQRLRATQPASPVALSGLTLTAKAIYAVLLWQSTGRPLLIVTDGSKEAEALAAAIDTFFTILAGGREQAGPQLLPALDVLPFQGLSPHAEILEERALGLLRMASQRAAITVTPIGSALLRVESRKFYEQLALTLRMREEIALEDLAAHLDSIGYERREPVEMVGEYSVRGGIVDVFSPEASHPVRIELFGDEIESIRRFDVESQRSVLKLESCTLLPLTEYPKPRNEATQPGWEFLVSLEQPRQDSVFSLMEKAIVVWDEPEQVRSAAERSWMRLAQTQAAGQIYFQWEELQAEAARLTVLEMRELAVLATLSDLHIAARPVQSFHGNMKVAIAEARTLVESGSRVVFFAASNGEIERLADILNEYGTPYQIGIDQSGETPEYLAERAYFAGSVAATFLVKGAVARGVFLADAGIAIFGSEDLFSTSELIARPASQKSHLATFSPDVLDLKPGDYVVHSEHGVGRFLGLREIAQGENKGDFMLIEYSAGSKLYVPLTRLDLVQRFRGAGDGGPAPTLDRLGGATWTRTKSKVKARMRDMAEELLKLYAARKVSDGFAFSADSNWQREFEDTFEFAETRDQLTAIKEIKRDMENKQPMDRLLCGDVGSARRKS